MSAAALCAAAAEAEAGAWMALEGGEQIVAITLGERDAFAVSEADVYLELPMNRRFAFIAQPRFSYSEETSQEPFQADVAAGVKAQLYRGPWAAAAVQASGVWRNEPEELSCGQGGGEVRALAGVSAPRSFYNIEAAFRLQSGGCARQRLEATAGFRPNDRWMAIGNTFLESTATGQNSVKAQASVVRFGPAGGLQIGLRFRLDGDRREPALVLGWWSPQRA
ncbi:MAG: hypothetical protein GC206_06675 [Alphaproteobacteria bacterium]|nr:hypothetical protein [Alphaproteobacteria bacterium]